MDAHPRGLTRRSISFTLAVATIRVAQRGVRRRFTPLADGGGDRDVRAGRDVAMPKSAAASRGEGAHSSGERTPRVGGRASRGGAVPRWTPFLRKARARGARRLRRRARRNPGRASRHYCRGGRRRRAARPTSALCRLPTDRGRSRVPSAAARRRRSRRRRMNFAARGRRGLIGAAEDQASCRRRAARSRWRPAPDFIFARIPATAPATKTALRRAANGKRIGVAG